MEVVFMNTLEKQTAEGRVLSAKVSIGERQGEWVVAWHEPDGGKDRQAVWFEGTSWEEMIAAFRHGVAVKLGEGYEPILDGMLEDRKGMQGGLVPMLQCFGELHARQEVFEALREWRKARATADRKAAYAVSTNRILWMISAFLPQSAEELKYIPGWGETKSAAYSAEVTGITKQFARTTTFPLTWVADVLEPDAYAKWLYKQKENKYRGELERHKTKRAILAAVQEGSGLDELQALLEIDRRELVERIEQLDREGYDMAPLLDKELERLPEEERSKIEEAIQAVGDRYLKPILKQVYSEAELDGKPLDPIYERLRLMRIRYKKQAAV
jgi:hypothetical protein